MKNFVFFVLIVLAVATLPDSAQAQAASFTWTCENATRHCSFDANCSDDTPLDFRWTFGDGTPTVFWGPSTITHTYGGTNASYYVTLSVGYLFIGYYDVTCRVQLQSWVGPPQSIFSGTCS